MLIDVRKMGPFILLLLLIVAILPTHAAAEKGPNIEVAYFYIEACSSCQSNRQFIDAFESDLHSLYPQVNVVIHRYNIFYEQSLYVYKSYIQAYSAENIILPAVFVGDTYLSGDSEIKQKLLPLIESYINGTKEYKEIKVDMLGQDKVIDNEKERFETFTPVGVALAGLLDGFNPCAVSMLLFFLSILVMSGRQNKELFLVGMSYIIGTFIAYFTIGIGLVKVGDIFKDAKAVMLAIYGLTIAMSIILAFFSFRDYISIKKGNYARISLQLPQKIRHVIQRYIRENTLTHFLYISVFLTGIVVSGLEFFCTGQVYLPTIVYILSQRIAVAKALSYLAIYNLAFVIPLIAVVIAVYMGKKVMNLSRVFVSKMHLIKLVTGLFFIAVAIVMFAELWGMI
ncbi:cytochrome c biogenesis CcdA family protein [Mahella australiensis]|uniref:Cytochrome c biogenesis protein transmembrane region n=1 Tax=Mahella australiensis (strain DSM 15567 / CIP 107919 / 50-1 BON) TaxID=697281 RepID=F3ZVQ8_MAHA5|nr:cytochrome c biogenesis protein CcdA [Mahella australiensis]AEE97452.1 cytochrome c biogenesis protein transmembrane region [Mahella australiensis 50-1 BON]